MAITKSAKKAIRSAARKRVFNLRTRRTLHKAVKGATPQGGSAALALAYQAIDKAAARGVIKKKTAARKKSRLVKRLKKTAAQ